jgi:16S rRNA (cytosine967-C5)-methyltransferase
VLRRHPESKWRRGDAEVAELARLQAALLDGLSAHVAPGGVLVYSVCTFTEEEGPAQVRRFLAAHPEFQLAPPPPAPGVDFAAAAVPGEPAMLRTWPHRHDADAFFAARLARRS